MTAANAEISEGTRFAFGKNWSRFLSVLDEDRVREAERSLALMVGGSDLKGINFLDVGSGSGLFSLAARRLGARVHSFDFDPQSVACTRELKRRYFFEDAGWKIEEGSALDSDYLKTLGTFDIVYSWGVLHHTGEMWKALGNVAPLVANGGKLFIAIYNDQGGASRVWSMIKRSYNQAAAPLKFCILIVMGTFMQTKAAVGRLIRGENPLPFSYWKQYKKQRGMSPWHDLVDWIGGFPFEVAKPEEIFNFYKAQGFTLIILKTCGGGLGCNEFVFVRQVNGGENV